MKPDFFKLQEHTYPGLNYKTLIQTKFDSRNILHTHDYYELLLVTKGRVEHNINGHTEQIYEGSLYIVRPNDVHQLTIHEDDSEYMNMNFSKELFEILLNFWDMEELRREINESEYPPLRRLDASGLKYASNKLLQTMFNESISFDDQNYAMKKCLFDVFTTFFVKDIFEHYEKGPTWLNDAMEQMKRKENFAIGVSRMVELSGRSMEHLSRSIMKYYGFSPTTYVNMLRVDYIASMLKCSDWPIIDIWLDAGFESAAYAYKLFKEKFGVTLRQYRKKWF